MKYDIVGRFWNLCDNEGERVKLNTTTNKDYAIFAVSVLQQVEKQSPLREQGVFAEYWYEARPGD